MIIGGRHMQVLSNYENIGSLRTKTGALCCVAAGPHGSKSNTNSRNYSIDPDEPLWRTNSSFSPLSRRWDCMFQSDALSNGSHGAARYGSSISSNSKGSRSRMSSERDLPNHHHSVSDGVLSYFGSPLDDVQAIPRWTPPGREFSFAEFSTPSMGGSRPETSPFSQSTERRFTARVSNSFGSASPCFESDQCESSSKQPMRTLSRNYSSRRSFISKPVYPLVFQNPVSDTEAARLADVTAGSRLNPGESSTSPFWRFSASNLERNFHKTLTDLQKIDSFVDPSSSSRREGFRWSNASSYDMGVDGESMDMAEHIELDNRRDLCYNSTDDPKCGLCGRLLRQKSPWGSYRIIRSGDMPVTGVLSCNHVFHADCLDQTTPKSHIHDPPCPVCLKTVDGVEPSSSISEPLKMALRSAQRNPGLSILTNDDNSNQSLDQSDGGLRRNRSLSTGRGGGSSSIKNHLKKHFSFKGKAGKDLFGAKVFCQGGSSSSVLPPRRSLVGRTKTLPSSKKK